MCWCIICEKLCRQMGAMPNDRWVRPTQLSLAPHGAHCVAHRAPSLAGFLPIPASTPCQQSQFATLIRSECLNCLLGSYLQLFLHPPFKLTLTGNNARHFHPVAMHLFRLSLPTKLACRCLKVFQCPKSTCFTFKLPHFSVIKELRST